jgi:hypothetical protein
MFAGRVVASLGAGVSFYPVKFLRQFGAVLLLLVACVAPAMACMAPDAQMTSEGRACCRMMKSQCGQMEMPASHGCCKKVPGNIQGSALKSDAVSLHPAVFVALWVCSFELHALQGANGPWAQHPEHAPPKPLSSSSSILRI